MTITLNVAFEERMKKILGDEYDDFFKEISNGKPTKAFFINKRTDKNAVLSFCTKKIPFFNQGYYYNFNSIGNFPLHHAGGVYVQDPSAMASIAALGEREFTNVLDMCASPGGKSLGASLKMKDGGVLVCNEFVPARCKTLVGNIERFGIKNAIVTNYDMTEKSELSDIYGDFFDLVICDAPCSGEGMFRKYPEEAISEWSVENVLTCAERQKAILDNAATFVSEGGLLLYSTCTFSLDENEMQTNAFLLRHPEFELIPVSEDVEKATAPGYLFDGCENESIILTRRFYPHISKGEGQYIALFRKTQGTTDTKKDKYKSPLIKPTDLEMKIFSDFIKKTVDNFDLAKVFKYNENLIYIDFDAKIPSKKVFACGVKLGEVIKSRFEPHHQFFKCFGDDFKNKVELCDNDERITKYLHGEVIEADIDNGWCAILYEGLPLGGGKFVDGTVKNHYPKGLRTM